MEIISVDKSYSTDKKVMDPNYSPKVSTWGVFERPANISEAYGGGRTIRAGTPLEDPAATQARKERIAAALSRLVTACCSVLGLPNLWRGPLLKFVDIFQGNHAGLHELLCKLLIFSKRVCVASHQPLGELLYCIQMQCCLQQVVSNNTAAHIAAAIEWFIHITTQSMLCHSLLRYAWLNINAAVCMHF